MALTKIQKQEITENLKEKISRQKVIIFVAVNNLKVNDLFNLRKKLKKAEAQLKVIKKTLLGLVLKEKKIEVDAKQLEGEIAVVLGFGDAIFPAKTLYEFSKEKKGIPKILGGFFEDSFRTAEEMINLAKLPSRETLLENFVRSLSSPMSNFVSVLEGNLKGLIFALNAIRESK